MRLIVRGFLNGLVVNKVGFFFVFFWIFFRKCLKTLQEKIGNENIENVNKIFV